MHYVDVFITTLSDYKENLQWQMMIKFLCLLIAFTAISITVVSDIMSALLLLALAYLLSAFLFV